ncbi:MAG: FxsB family radical SAM/SPASM domain protein [Hamadaea sp.]|nr:FxsB family radical SAM/SPASM domain protein [Hamadaea sp.]
MSQYVLKVHSRCDLACDHCYIYEHADQSWRGRPRAMTAEVVRQAGRRIAEHAAAHGLARVRVVLHGGEPLLMGVAGLRSTLELLSAQIAPVAALDLGMQTNGVRLSPEFCDLFVEFGVRVGVSLDGDRPANDRHRRHADGAGSHDAVCAALALLRRAEYRSSYAGLLCTVDVENDPIAVYQALLAEQPPRIDFLLPHATWAVPPPRPGPDPTPYATWLLAVYHRWTDDGRPVPIRFLDSVLSLGRGGRSGTESLGLDPADVVVIETDGAWEQPDSMKTAFDGAPATGLDVFGHGVDDVTAVPAIAERQAGAAALCATCRSCPVVGQCGGGLYAHRYRPGSDFANPSVYCADLKRLITMMNGSRTSDRPEPVLADPPPQVLDAIAGGAGDAEAVRFLADSQHAIVRALWVAAADRVGGPGAMSRRVLERVDAQAPEAVRAVLSHPYVRVWAIRCLEGTPDATYLAGLAAAAALRGGVSAEVVVKAGAVHLPTVGTVRLPDPGEPALLRIEDGTLTVGRPAIGAPVRPVAADSWLPTRRVLVDGLAVAIEDGDPYRDCHDWPVEGRLAEPQARSWLAMIEGAWAAVRRDAPGHTSGLRVGLSAIAPLTADPANPHRSATSRHAFGAMCATHSGVDELAVMLVHEFQHSKLGAILDLVDLLDPDRRSERLAVAWRPDPRPLEGVLQGVYAHLGVADVWRSRHRAEPADPLAATWFRRYRDWTASALDALLGTGALTPRGVRFATRMGETLHGWPQ